MCQRAFDNVRHRRRRDSILKRAGSSPEERLPVFMLCYRQNEALDS